YTTLFRSDVHVVRVRLERVPEEDHEADPALGDARSHLLVAAQGSAQEAVHGEPQLRLEPRAGRPGGVELVARQRAAVEARPVQQVELAVVVSDERDALALTHWERGRRHRESLAEASGRAKSADAANRRPRYAARPAAVAAANPRAGGSHGGAPDGPAGPGIDQETRGRGTRAPLGGDAGPGSRGAASHRARRARPVLGPAPAASCAAGGGRRSGQGESQAAAGRGELRAVGPRPTPLSRPGRGVSARGRSGPRA